MTFTNVLAAGIIDTGRSMYKIVLYLGIAACVLAIIVVETLGPVVMTRTADNQRIIHIVAVALAVIAGFLIYAVYTLHN